MQFIHRRLTYANVAMTVAALFAMAGGAYAAHKYIITSTGQIAPGVLKKLHGATGHAGPAGPAGVAGSVGPVGSLGAAGKDGLTGQTGGTGPQGATGPTGAGGVTGKAGVTGVTGPTGFTGVTGVTGPAPKNIMGTWSISYNATAADQPGTSAISYTLPMKSEPELHYIGTNEELAGEKNESDAIEEGKCKGNAEGPEAATGNTCVFALVEENAGPFLLNKILPVHFQDSSDAGVVVADDSEGTGQVLAFGSWAAGS